MSKVPMAGELHAGIAIGSIKMFRRKGREKACRRQIYRCNWSILQEFPPWYVFSWGRGGG